MRTIGLFGLAGFTLLCAVAADAQVYPPNNKEYECRWSKHTGGSATYGESKVTFLNLTGTPFERTGQLKTEYVGLPPVTQAVKLSWSGWNGENYFVLELPGTNPLVKCSLLTFVDEDTPSRLALRFDGRTMDNVPVSPAGMQLCTNGAFQLCSRFNDILR
jgi:hypothetical protein